jgi:hypothetical protein
MDGLKSFGQRAMFFIDNDKGLDLIDVGERVPCVRATPFAQQAVGAGLVIVLVGLIVYAVRSVRSALDDKDLDGEEVGGLSLWLLTLTARC